MRDLVKKTIDGSEYQFTQFSTTLSLKLLKRLTVVLGEPIVVALGSMAKKEGESLLDKQIDFDVMAFAAKALITNLDKEDPVDLIETLVAKDNLLCDGKRIVFDLHYAGRLPHMFKVLKAALEVQYGNFIPAITGSLGSFQNPITNQA